MHISLEPGRYIIAVSGGVDSMVLLDVLCQLPGVELIVAHIDHGIRTDSVVDRRLVQTVVTAHRLIFEYKEAHLAPDAGEAEGRSVRYAFLEALRQKYKARAIITAHHQDDVLETAILNLLRGTGRKGLSSLQSSQDILRPLLHIPKSTIRAYAEAHKLQWREDVTNQDERYLRNYVRRNIVGRLSAVQKQQLENHIARASRLNRELDALLLQELRLQTTRQGLRRNWFIQLPHIVAAEVMAAWLRSSAIRSFDRKLINRLVVAAKTARAGKRLDIDAEHTLHVAEQYIAIEVRPPS